MAKVINIVGASSNVGKTFVMEGLIKELKSRNLKIATIKHDVHGFDIDHEGKDTYKHRKAGADTIIISSKNRYAEIRELDKEIDLKEIIEKIYKKNDIVLVEGYKNSPLRKIEIYRDNISPNIISPPEKIIAIASDVQLSIEGIKIVQKTDFKAIADLIEVEKEFNIENY
ncbi:MAG: molybdopterin-guanine dinucleotide biosynthesis protein B [Peptostreptococcaceae bacterium]